MQCRTEKQLAQRRKLAKMPLAHNLDNYDSSLSNGISNTQLNQLRELHWVDECYNIMLTGPCGVGKTLIASGLCNDAINKGYKAYFRCMEEILNTLKTKDLIPSAKQEYKRLREAHVIVIDDLMNISVSQEEGNLFFSFVNNTFESTSYIITTNKSPAEWAKALDDEVLATALLDRILFKCQLIQLSGYGKLSITQGQVIECKTGKPYFKMNFYIKNIPNLAQQSLHYCSRNYCIDCSRFHCSSFSRNHCTSCSCLHHRRM